jgi:hypothetical protein
MDIKEEVAKQIDSLSESELRQVAQYLAFLKHKSKIQPLPEYDEQQLAALYAEFAEEDQELAEEGMTDYARALEREDAR